MIGEKKEKEKEGPGGKKTVDNPVLPPSFILLLWSWLCVSGLHVSMYYSSYHFLLECTF